MKAKEILFATDFSDNTLQAFDYAKKLAVQFESKLLVLHVVNDVEDARLHSAAWALHGEILENIITESTKEMMGKYIEEHVGDFDNYETMICHGKPFVEILKKCEEQSVDLVVVGTHGHTGIDHVIFGSTAERVVRDTKVPVFVVPSGK